jgi:enoyl-CoA hydratase/carnithine racemase
MAETTVLCEVKDGVAELTLNRLERMNAYTPQMGADLSRQGGGAARGRQ